MHGEGQFREKRALPENIQKYMQDSRGSGLPPLPAFTAPVTERCLETLCRTGLLRWEGECEDRQIVVCFEAPEYLAFRTQIMAMLRREYEAIWERLQ